MKKISILIAVRNEENIILLCLEKLKKAINFFYKIEENKTNFELEILIGDDNSNDKSSKIIKHFIEKNQDVKCKYYEIIQNNLKGKVNVIHQLINHSEGETIILLDADILVNQNWLQELVKTYYQNDKIKMVMGTTIPKNSSVVVDILAKRDQQQFFTTFQIIDWIFGQGVLAIFSKLGYPQTAMGNNLIFDKKIYQEIGGYEKIEFSVTEDVALFKAFQNYLNGRWWGHQQRQKNNCQIFQSVRQLEKQKKTYHCSCLHARTINKKQFFIQLFNADSLAFTETEPTLKDWILQRHRWFCGAWQFSNFIKKGILIAYLFRIIFLLGIIIAIILSGNLYLILSIFITLGVNFLLIILFFIKLKLKINLLPSSVSPPTTILQIIIFCLIEPFLYFLVGIHFLKTKKVKWKGREF
ncbi:glycosyl transferase [Bernardetia litoralis DSM 6794]|uniref:Glycosyl transferase n=1 Tax=Bernardetia litoralis (strain ATCC 23117 / DSM 6794 / NBRC 15988 / NCIMB 1366 / Fx l1 / Sio-4) TaxID=880071 RepID=I4AI76_BERLS|nr:glycosyltransferase [Bernardetia litoralis]AFM03661.1 glycosyl transferase [Bernardetia litoralis DSM 6794]